MTRIGDKYGRLKNLVKEESIRDTLLDMTNFVKQYRAINIPGLQLEQEADTFLFLYSIPQIN